MDAKEILRRPYRRVLIPDDTEPVFTAMIAEFPGCIAEGTTPDEAYRNLDSAAESWIEAAIDSGLDIPEPDVELEYSGRVVLRMSKSTHRRAADAARVEGVSLNTFLVSAVSERVGTSSLKRDLASMREQLMAAIRAPINIQLGALGVGIRSDEPAPTWIENDFHVGAGTANNWSVPRSVRPILSTGGPHVINLSGGFIPVDVHSMRAGE